MIPDVQYTPAPLVPATNPRTGAPVDLSLCQLRSVSPVHLEYLRNMGVSATMTISLIKGTELWGLIACHHYSPKLVSFELRLASELLGQALSNRVRLLSERRERERGLRAGAFLSEVVHDFLSFDDWIEPLLERSHEVMEMVGATGLAVVEDTRIERAGRAPDADRIRDLVGWLHANTVDELPFATDSLSAVAPEVGELGTDSAGLLAVRIPVADRGWILWFRPEQRREVRWGGDPHKPVEVTDSDRLSPRRSFELWLEEVRGTSRPWDDVDRDAASQLRLRVSNSILTTEAARVRGRRDVDRISQELEDLLLGTTHDLRAPVRGIRLYSQILLDDHSTSLRGEPEEVVRSVIKLVDRMDRLLESLLYYSRVGRVELRLEQVKLEQVVQEVVELLRPAIGNIRIEVESHLPTVRCDRERVFEVFLNLIDNAVKYSRPEAPEIRVGTLEADDGRPLLFVRDNGIGIAERHHEDVFRVFRRLHGPGEYGGGSGAGLTVVRKVVQLHGGEVWLESAPGEGSVFYFTLQPSAHATK